MAAGMLMVQLVMALSSTILPLSAVAGGALFVVAVKMNSKAFTRAAIACLLFPWVALLLIDASVTRGLAVGTALRDVACGRAAALSPAMALAMATTIVGRLMRRR